MPSSNPQPTGKPVAKKLPIKINEASLYVDGVPVWWSREKMPEQVKVTTAYLDTLCGIAAFKSEPRNGLLLYGPPGTGKTSSGVGLLYIWGQARRHACFQDFGELMIRIRSAWSPKLAGETTDKIMEEMLRPDILLLDDINKRAAPEDQETLCTVFNGRINRGKPTICTTNCDLSTPAGNKEFLATADSRVLERFSGCDIHLDGKNLRRAE